MARAKLTEAEKARRKAERKAADMTARDLKSLGGPGSMFADLVRVWTPEEAARHQQLGKMTDGYPFLLTNAGNYGLEMIHVAALVRLAEARMGPAEAEALREYVTRTYPDSYWGMVWREVLTGRRAIATKFALCCVTARPHVVEYDRYPSPGFAPYRPEELPAKPNHKPNGPVTDDDPEGWFPRVMARLGAEIPHREGGAG